MNDYDEILSQLKEGLGKAIFILFIALNIFVVFKGIATNSTVTLGFPYFQAKDLQLFDRIKLIDLTQLIILLLFLYLLIFNFIFKVKNE